MYKVALINMPFGALHLPSIALTQLQVVLADNLPGEAQADIHYLNHDFVEYFGLERYKRISDSVMVTATGLGDWLFRELAFPGQQDNTQDYQARYARQLTSGGAEFQDYLALRQGLDAYLDRLIERYQLDRYALVGFTSMFAQNAASIALARKLKQHNPDIVTVIGGANCETSLGAVIARRVEVIDFVFSGPALKNFPSLIRYLVDGEAEKCHALNGVYSGRKLARELVGSQQEIGEELDVDTLIRLDYDDFLNSLEQTCPGTRASLLFETSRGCWWGERSHCTFCGLNGNTMTYRAMSSELALEQFDDLFRYSAQVDSFKSVDNIMPREYLKSVFPKLRPPKDATLFYEIKSDIKEREMQVLAEAGVSELQPGIEALSTSTLKLMNKGVSSFQNLVFLKNCLVYGINPLWNLLIGFPGEQEQVYEKYAADIPALVHLPPPSGVYPVRFDRFSPYHSQAEQYGLKLKPYQFYSMVYPFPEQDLEDLAYFFADQNHDSAYISSTVKWIGKLAELIADWNAKWESNNGKQKPGLTFEWHRDTRVVQDTRNGGRQEHEVDPLGFEVLEQLGQPMKLARLAVKIPGASESELKDRVDLLLEKELLFHEDDKYVSLVVDYAHDSGYV
jgi:ribosomal peptide maturation radical SAM protein 1